MLSLTRKVLNTFPKSSLSHMLRTVLTVEDFEREFYSPCVANYSHNVPGPVSYSIIESNLSLGQNHIGVGFGPMHLVNSRSFINFIQQAHNQKNWSMDHHIKIDISTDQIDKSNFTDIKNVEKIDKMTSRIFTANNYTSNTSDFTINLMGDHSSSIGTIASGFEEILIWIDAHGDINTPDSSITKNCHGMPLSIASGLCKKTLRKHNLFTWIPQWFPLENIIYVGIRDLDPYETEIIEKHNIMVIQEDSSNIEMDAFYKKIRHKFTHVSFDVDALDPQYISCTGTPVDGGLSPSFVRNLMYEINMRSTLTRLDVVEFNPHINPNDINKCTHTIVDTIFKPLIA